MGIEFDCPVEQPQRLAVRVSGPPTSARQSTQIVIICIEVLGRLSLGALDFSPLQPRCDRAYYVGGHAVLQVEDVFELALEAIRPEMRSCRGIDELSGDANPVGRLTYATF